MTTVNLTEIQQEMRNQLETMLEQVSYDNEDMIQEERMAIFDEMARVAHELHMSIEPHPRHHANMIENRGLQPDNPLFYRHIHPVQDLIRYLDDTDANRDPLDATIGAEFYFNVYSNRWGHRDRYTLIRTEEGWNVSFMSHNSTGGDKEGEPGLTSALIHDSISYPRNIGSYMYSIWERAKNEGLTHEEVQDLLNQVADWISLCEENAPNDILF